MHSCLLTRLQVVNGFLGNIIKGSNGWELITLTTDKTYLQLKQIVNLLSGYPDHNTP